MSVSSSRRSAWKKKFERLNAALATAEGDRLVAIYEATEEGVTQADVAYMMGGVAPSGVKAKAVKGKAVKEARARA